MLLYFQGRARCDPYGRLPGDPEILHHEVMSTWASEQQWTDDDFRQARDALVQARVMHLYTVAGVEYLEYEHYDDDQDPSRLKRRAAKFTYPDPPDRPELAAARRPHNVGESKKGKAPAPGAVREPGPAAVLSAGEEPSAVSVAETPAVTLEVAPEADDAETARREAEIRAERERCIAEAAQVPPGYSQLQQCHEAHFGSLCFAPGDKAALLAVMEDAAKVGVEWQTLRTVMMERQEDYIKHRATSKEPRIKRIGYYRQAWDELIERAKAAPGKKLWQMPAPDDDDPPDESPEEIELRRRIADQNEQLRQYNAAKK
jgi:hypothetical protein